MKKLALKKNEILSTLSQLSHLNSSHHCEKDSLGMKQVGNKHMVSAHLPLNPRTLFSNCFFVIASTKKHEQLYQPNTASQYSLYIYATSCIMRMISNLQNLISQVTLFVINHIKFKSVLLVSLINQSYFLMKIFY